MRLRRVRGLDAMAAQFHVGLNVHDGWKPFAPTALIPGRLHQLRLDLLDEEVGELHEAVEQASIDKIADALGDIAYVVMGTAFTYGIPLDQVLSAVHKSNMTKVNDAFMGKLVKPEGGYEPPAIAAVLSAAYAKGARKRLRYRLAQRMHRFNLVRAWTGRASKWHAGERHHEVVCSYEEWAAQQPKDHRKTAAQ
jgi:NTP pyrophosphatase (non-canonical NTP hydrolase)